jgi:tRNA A37 threonylcarbamoyladenosine synthetase subunit TsaC/SUA5/YrdC
LTLFDRKVDVVLNGGSLSTLVESTVVTSSRAGVKVLRDGAISRGEMRKALGPNVELQD